MKLPINPRTAPDGVILVFSVRFPNSVKTYNYVLVKQGGLWYSTGTGRVPQAAGWGAVERWLVSDDRVVERVEIVTGQKTIWPEPVGTASPVATSQA